MLRRISCARAGQPQPRCERHVPVVVGERDVGDQPRLLAQLGHDVVTGIDAQRAGDAFELLAVPDVDAHGADDDAGVAVDAVAGVCRPVLDAFIEIDKALAEAGATVVLNGHLDTVGVDGMTDPFTPAVDGDRIEWLRAAFDAG